MPYAALSDWAVTALVLGLRIMPVFAFAPPFTLIRVPRLMRVLMGLALSASLLGASPHAALLPAGDLGGLLVAAAHELGIGLMVVLAFQLAFGALYLAGRTIDVQAGFGLAMLIDPTTRSQTPLIGTLFAYAAGAMFFAADGHIELLKLLGASLDAIPLGTWVMPHSIARVSAFTGLVFLSAFGVAGAAILALFLVDMSIAMLSRTVPQMNVLVFGIQVKTVVLLLVLPASFGIGGALLLRLMTTTLQAIPRML
ncbi:MAG TPA: flagellar biosynthetic protein FliR [Rhizomicrobium sp.]|nr:flagellar biosynthetic protein FliR [Rhizomicrobium sp.]